ncbi:MAG: hypothetical protein H0U70_02495 [Tatlockia sp.]|nr:hypothetical protein [Tatlockia sp.]
MREAWELNGAVEDENYIVESATTQDLSDWKIVTFDENKANSELEKKNNTLNQLFDYLIKETGGNPIPFRKSDMFGLFLEILGSSGGIYSWPPAEQYAKGMAPWIKYSFAITNPLSNVLFLIKTTDDLFDTIQRELQIPDELNNLIEAPTNQELAIKYLKLGLGSVVCVIPFGIVAYLFPLPNCAETWCVGLTVTHSILTNIILHAVSWSFILAPELWYYRLPILPLEISYKKLMDWWSSEFERKNAKLTLKQQTIYDRYKDILIQTFSLTSQQIVQQYLSKEDSSEKQLRAIQDDEMSFVNFTKLRSIQEIPKPPSTIKLVLSKVNNFLLNGGVGVLGAGIMVTGCMGWIGNPFYIGYLANLTLPAMISAGSLPSYSTGVLCAFYGSAIFNQIYSYFTTWNGIRDKFSPEAQMYPKTFALFLLINLYISFFSFATGAHLINTIFVGEIWNGLRETLYYICIPTLQVLSFIPLINLFNLFIRKTTAKMGSLDNDDTLAARLLLKSEIMPYYLKQLKGDELIKSIQKYSDDQLNALGVNAAEFEEDVEKLDKLSEKKIKLYSVGGKNLFFADTKNEGGPLLKNHTSLNTSIYKT